MSSHLAFAAAPVALPSAAAAGGLARKAVGGAGKCNAVSSTRGHQRVVGRRAVISSGIGFDLGGGEGSYDTPDREAAKLIEDAASLLFLQDCMRGEVAQAYLVLLSQIAIKAGL